MSEHDSGLNKVGGFITRYSDALMGLGVLGLLVTLITPMPPLFLDLLLALNITTVTRATTHIIDWAALNDRRWVTAARRTPATSCRASSARAPSNAGRSRAPESPAATDRFTLSRALPLA